MPRLRSTLSVLLSCLLVTLVGAASASAAAPNAGPDSMAAAPNGVHDVLNNDSDDGGGAALRVTGTTAPSHGTVSCAALGSCFYKAEDGFAGADAFTYTVSDGDTQSIGTVSVNVATNVSAKALIARDDDTATLAGRAVTVKVLDNDTGRPPLTVSSSNPTASHGTASCDQTTCTYTPEPGFTGADGFAYRIYDSNERSATAAVHVLVAPENTSYNLSVRGTPADPTSAGAVPSGGLANWFIGVGSVPEGITGEELGALPLPSGSANPDGPHALTPDAVRTATGWKSGTGAGGAVTLEATKNALLGEGVTEGFPKPLPPISQGTGGDGHVPILVGSKVFAFYHHSSPTSATCVDRLTGLACPGYPKQLDWNTTNIPGPGVVVGEKIYYFLYQGSGANTLYGLYCWDASADTTCGYVPTDRGTDGYQPGQSAPVLAGGKIWFAANTGRLYCVDPDTAEPCATPSVPTGLGTGAGPDAYDITSHGTRVFVARTGDKVSCFDTQSNAACTGWETPQSFGGNGDVINHYNTTGDADGVCLVTYGGNGDCVTDADPTTRFGITKWPRTDYFYSKTLDAETGTRTLVGSLSHPGMGCFDWTTSKPCTGGGYDSTGWLNLPYEQMAYGVAYDGSCAIGVGDPGQVYTVDPEGSAPCLSLRSGAKQKAVDLRDQRCDGGVGSAKWRDVTLTDTNAEEMDAITITVRDARTKEILATGNLIDGDHKLDLSGIDTAAHPSITVDANAKSKSGNHAWDDSIPPRITVHWKSDVQQACVDTRGASECGPSAPLGIKMLGHLDAPAKDEQAGLDLVRNACSSAPQPAAAPAAGAQPVAAAAVPRQCSGLRKFRIHLRYDSKKVRTVTVTIDGKKQQLVSMKGRPVFRVDLTGRSKKTTTVRIVIVDKAGKKIVGKRVYKPCTKKLPDRGFQL